VLPNEGGRSAKTPVDDRAAGHPLLTSVALRRSPVLARGAAIQVRRFRMNDELPLRTKVLFFAAVLALFGLVIAGIYFYRQYRENAPGGAIEDSLFKAETALCKGDHLCEQRALEHHELRQQLNRARP
jgi:hypothetical protein